MEHQSSLTRSSRHLRTTQEYLPKRPPIYSFTSPQFTNFLLFFSQLFRNLLSNVNQLFTKLSSIACLLVIHICFIYTTTIMASCNPPRSPVSLSTSNKTTTRPIEIILKELYQILFEHNKELENKVLRPPDDTFSIETPEKAKNLHASHVPSKKVHEMLDKMLHGYAEWVVEGCQHSGYNGLKKEIRDIHEIGIKTRQPATDTLWKKVKKQQAIYRNEREWAKEFLREPRS
jgi:hypothetical protein